MSIVKTAGQTATPDAGSPALSAETQTEESASVVEPKTAREPRQAVGITCGRCGHRWTGANAAHCTGCCLTAADPSMATFASPSLFDAHRRETGERGRCLDPAAIVKTRGAQKGERVMFHRDGMWRSPAMSDEEKLARFGGLT